MMDGKQVVGELEVVLDALEGGLTDSMAIGALGEARANVEAENKLLKGLLVGRAE